MYDDHTKRGIRPMMATPGYTAKRFSRLPLADEGEASIGPDHINPYRSEKERRATEELMQLREERQRRENHEGDAFLNTIPSERARIDYEEPTKGDDPFAFDDVSIGGIDDTAPFESVGQQSVDREELAPDQPTPTEGNDPYVFDDIQLATIGDAQAFDSLGGGEVHPIIRPLHDDKPRF